MSTRVPALPNPGANGGPRHIFVPHPRHENVAIMSSAGARIGQCVLPSAKACRVIGRNELESSGRLAERAHSDVT